MRGIPPVTTTTMSKTTQSKKVAIPEDSEPLFVIEDKHGNEIVKDHGGKWVKGVSGNPNGRPKGRKNHITELKQGLEIAIRENLTPHQVARVVNAMLEQALAGNVQAGKLILDKVLSNAKDADDAQENNGGLRIIIQNASVEAIGAQHHTTIESTVEESDEEAEPST